ncbi:unnamed protein product [Urochloa decumbens]|uniref:Uncharacterized protein n=1 Tax=Urochloa decumbens TaxID=240449 RepID=A0ABC9BT04_9POAL
MPNSKTVSTFSSQREQGTHLFHISGYSQLRRSVSELILSDKFSVGGHDWGLLFEPDWYIEKKTNGFNSVNSVVGLFLLGRNTKAQASVELRLLDQGTGPSLSLLKLASREFDANEESKIALCKIKQQVLETYLWYDRLTIECVVTVMKAPLVTKSRSFPRIEVPPSDIAEQFGKLLETKVGVDVTFSVHGVNFTAHKMVLATRSPVFCAEFYGPMREEGTEPIVVEDIQPDVFRALLHFIYNDSLPPFDDLQADDYSEMIRHLLVAADRYNMERLKLMCQSILCESLHVQTVATTMALADQHHCDMLKDACIEFITCSNAMDAVAATPGYKSLKRTCPSVAIEALEKTSRIRKA